MKPKQHNLKKKLLKFQRKHLTAFKASGWLLLLVIVAGLTFFLTGAPSWTYEILSFLLYAFWYLQGRDDARYADAKALRTLREYRLGIQVANESWEAIKGSYKALGVNATPAAESIYNEYRFEMEFGPKNAIEAFNRTINRKRERLNERRASVENT